MNKLFSLILAFFLIGLAINSLISGETFGFAARGTVPRTITIDSNPIQFILAIVLQFSFAGWILKDLANKREK